MPGKANLLLSYPYCTFGRAYTHRITNFLQNRLISAIFWPIPGDMDSFHDEHGQPLTFSYLPEFGRLAYIAIPDPKDDPQADADAMRGIRQWFRNRSRYGLESAIWGCIRTVCDVAGSPHIRGPNGDWNGDKLGEGIVAVLEAFTTPDGGPYDPSSDDGVEFVDPDFWAPIVRQRRGKTFDKLKYDRAEVEHAQRARKSKSHYVRRYAKLRRRTAHT